MSNLITRSLSGIIYVALVVAGVMVSDVTMLLLTMLLAVPALKEFSLMAGSLPAKSATQSQYPVGKPLSARVVWLEVCGLLLIAGVWQLVQYGSAVTLGIFLLALLARMVAAIYSHESRSLTLLIDTLAALVYVALPLALLNYIYYYSNLMVLLLFVFIWLNDTGAFIFGSAFGRHRLFPSISPKKSWEGFIGGMAVVIITATLLGMLSPRCNFIPPYALVTLGVVVSAFATWGDLLESFVKRTAGVKDSGNLMPGHGGALDRIDSLLAVSLAATAFIMIL